MNPREYMVRVSIGGGGEETSFYDADKLDAALADAEEAGGQVFEVRKIADFEPDE